MPYASNNGVRIHYEVEGNGPSLLLVHGFLDSLEVWHEAGYVDSLKQDYQLVLIDMRGHGASDKPHNPEVYRFEWMATDLIAVLDKLNIKKAHFLGYSMGGRLGFSVAKCALNRFNSFIFGGTHPFDMTRTVQDSFLQVIKKGMGAMIACLREEWGMKITPQLEARWVTNDAEALAAFLTGSQWGVGLEKVLHTMTVPCLVYCGECDGVYSAAKKSAAIMPNSTFVSFPSLDHIETLIRSDIVLPHIRKFLEQVSRT